MSKITKDQAKDLSKAFQCWQQDYDQVEDKEQYDMFGLGIVAMDALLASLEAEPVAWQWEYRDKNHVTNDPARAKFVAQDGDVAVQPLFTAPPAPAYVPDDFDFSRLAFEKWITENYDSRLMRSGTGYAGRVLNQMWQCWLACRAAMLQGAEHVIDVEALSALIEGMEVSVDVSTCDADAGHRYFGTVTEISELDGAKNGYILLVQDAEPNFVPTGNSPVIPDGWVACSERIPEEIGRYWCYVEEQNSLGKSHYQWNCSWNGELWGGEMMYGRVTHWMPLPAAPQ